MHTHLGDRSQALEQREECAVVVRQRGPPLQQRRQQHVDVSRHAELGADGVSEGAQGIVENQQILGLR